MKIAIIPARKGSKRLPMKNIRPFFGKPVIQHTIEAALASKCFQRIIVSSNDQLALETAEKMKVEAWPRPEELARDSSTLKDVCFHVLNRLGPERVDAFCLLLATAPMRGGHDIEAAYQILVGQEAGCVMGVTDYSISPFYALKKDSDGFLQMLHPEMAGVQSQHFPETLADNGSMYWCDRGYFLEYGTFYGPHLKGYVMPRYCSVDIDTEADWDLAEYYYKSHVMGRDSE